jgi:hypothetical protein
MEINFSTELSSVARTPGLTPKVNSVVPASEGVSFSNTEALNQALAATPDVRSEAVERGRSLVSDRHYPPDEMIRKLATFLAPGWEAPS